MTQKWQRLQRGKVCNMNYHNITKDDMLNGSGLRVVLWLSGCDHHCKNCQNPQTWDCNGGIEFDLAAKEEIFEQLNEDYISGITFSGGDPLHKKNLHEVLLLCNEIRNKFPTKTIWLYTGYTWEDIWSDSNIIVDDITLQAHEDYQKRQLIILSCDVLIDGRFIQELADVNYHWAGSTNQRVIDVQKTFEKGEIVLWDTF